MTVEQDHSDTVDRILELRLCRMNNLQKNQATVAKKMNLSRGVFMRGKYLFHMASVALVALGLGILLSFFMPACALVVIEALLIITIGCMTLLKH